VQSVLAASDGPDEQLELARASAPTKAAPTLRPINLDISSVLLVSPAGNRRGACPSSSRDIPARWRVSVASVPTGKQYVPPDLANHHGEPFSAEDDKGPMSLTFALRLIHERLRAYTLTRPMQNAGEGFMSIDQVLAVIPVSDIDAAQGWYEQLLGRPADNNPMVTLAEWRITDSGWLQVFLDPERAGSTFLNFAVHDLDAHLSELRARGLPSGTIEAGGKSERLSSIIDPDGNRITFIGNFHNAF
jgi:glyoxylase I family protein